MSKEVPVSIKKRNRNEIVGGLLGQAAETNREAAPALLSEKSLCSVRVKICKIKNNNLASHRKMKLSYVW